MCVCTDDPTSAEKQGQRWCLVMWPLTWLWSRWHGLRGRRLSYENIEYVIATSHILVVCFELKIYQ